VQSCDRPFELDDGDAFERERSCVRPFELDDGDAFERERSCVRSFELDDVVAFEPVSAVASGLVFVVAFDPVRAFAFTFVGAFELWPAFAVESVYMFVFVSVSVFMAVFVGASVERRSHCADSVGLDLGHAVILCLPAHRPQWCLMTVWLFEKPPTACSSPLSHDCSVFHL
jgi:hypothetical protein